MTDNSAEEAFRRAQEIAAKLRGETVTAINGNSENEPANGATNNNNKRRRWGVMPGEDNNTNTETVSNNNNKKQKKEATSKRIWVTAVSKERPAVHFVSFVGKEIPKIIAKIHGTEEVEQDASKEDEDEKEKDPEKLYITFKGKGSSNTPPLPGMPEEPLHVLLEGPIEYVTQAEDVIENLLQEAEKAPVDEQVVQNHERQLVAAGKLSLEQLRNGSYKPAAVSTMISATLPTEKLAAALLHDVDNKYEIQIHVPNGVVGFIIGRGGETIASLQAQTACRVQIQKEHELQPGQTERILTLSAATQESIDECKQRIERMVADRIRIHNNNNNNNQQQVQQQQQQQQAALDNNNNNNGIPPGHVAVDCDVPNADVGLIIGKMGVTIKSIQQQSGATIQVPKTGNIDNPSIRTLKVIHPNEQGASYAKQLIEDVLKTKLQHNQQHQQQQQQQPVAASASIQINIPDKDVGLCIGRQGCVIKFMQNSTNTRIQIPQHPNPGELHRVATISGNAEGCQQVRQMIERIVQEQSASSIMTGAPGAQQQQHHQQQHEYSAEWAAYHAAQQAAAQQQTTQQHQQPLVTQQQQPVAAAAPAPVADTTYHEQFFRYAYYYGEDAARQYYGAWAPPPGTPNPYGVNPNGITPAPAAAATAQQHQPASNSYGSQHHTMAQASAAQQQARETSRRQVSNLPAWMTQK